MSYLVLLRHGKVPAYDGDPEKVQGWRNDPSDQAAAQYTVTCGADRAMADLFPTHIVTSDLHRAQYSALAVLKRIRADGDSATLEPSPRLRPWHMGELEGHVRERVWPIIDQLLEHPARKIVSGEAFDTFRMRWLPTFHQLVHIAQGQTDPLIAVTHSWNVKLADAWLTNAQSQDYTFDTGLMEQPAEIEPGQWMTYNLLPSGKIVRSAKAGASSRTSSSPAKPNSATDVSSSRTTKASSRS
jgi:broad specificity phosphatase PhoE